MTNCSGTCRRMARVALLLSGVLLLSQAHAEELSGAEILDRVEKLLWGRTVQGNYEMTIKTPRWQRTLSLRVWMDRPSRSFVRILAPAKEAGIGSLRIGNEMWNYLPAVERTIKIPPSMMLQPWMGSDFTNDDLVKESSIVSDYTHQISQVSDGSQDGGAVLRIDSTPKPESAVVWGKIVYWVQKRNFIPLKEEFYSERGQLVRVLTFSDVRTVGGRVMPTRWEMRPVAKEGNMTTVLLKDAVFDQPVNPEVFTQRNLQKP